MHLPNSRAWTSSITLPAVSNWYRSLCPSTDFLGYEAYKRGHCKSLPEWISTCCMMQPMLNGKERKNSGTDRINPRTHAYVAKYSHRSRLLYVLGTQHIPAKGWSKEIVFQHFVSNSIYPTIFVIIYFSNTLKCGQKYLSTYWIIASNIEHY